MERFIKKIALIFATIFMLTSVTFASPANFSGLTQNNTKISLSDYRGKYVILVFWATWCPPCRMELPHIQNLYEKYGKNMKDIVFIGMNDENHEEVKNFLEKNHINFPTIIGKQNVFPVNAYPTMIILNKEGNLLDHAVGMIPEQMLDNYIKLKLEQNKEK